MQDPDINEEVLEDIIPDAIAGDEQALKALIFCVWFTKVLNNISRNAEKKLHVDAAELRDLTLDTLIKSINSIDNRNNQSWRDCVAGWCKIVCVRHALNILRQRRKFEARAPENDERKPKEIPSAAGALITETSAELNELRQIAHLVILSFSPVDVMITYMWAEGLKLRVISTLTGIPYQTVNKRQKKVQKAIASRIASTQKVGTTIAVQELLKGESELVGGFHDLVLKSLENVGFLIGGIQVIEPVKSSTIVKRSIVDGA